MAIYRAEVLGPLPIGGGREYWAIIVFDDAGRKIGTFDAYSEAEALAIKDEVVRRFSGE